MSELLGNGRLSAGSWVRADGRIAEMCVLSELERLTRPDMNGPVR
ncbi:hypothetical protein [Streptomyces sp. Agncl-13]